MNIITKKFDDWYDKPDLSFEKMDDLNEFNDANSKQIYKEFKEMEEKYELLFRIARRIEGIPKNAGVHASGVLVTPMPVTDMFPVRYKDDLCITLFDGPTLEAMGAIKYDLLGLKTTDVIEKTIKLINNDYSYYNMYDIINITDKQMFTMIQEQKTDGLFQLESDLFKHTISEMVPESLLDIAALNAICRPGPLKAGLDKTYNDTKNGRATMTEPLPNTLDIVKETYGAIIYQEQFMSICVQVCGFDVGQSDSIGRKTIAKKKAKDMAKLRRMMIYGKKNTEGPEGWEENNELPWYDPNAKYGSEICGALAKGYTIKQMTSFWDMITGFCDYMFNKSHAMCYGYLGLITAYLKSHYSLQFMTALLSMQTESDKIDRYIDVCHDMQINVLKPDINKSKRDFSIQDKNIMFGFSGISGVGGTSIDPILNNQPYANFKDFCDRTSGGKVNKRVVTNMIKSGCFDCFNTDRHSVIKEYCNIRNSKDDQPLLDITQIKYTPELCMEYEKELLGVKLTARSEWDKAKNNDYLSIDNFTVEKITEKKDKKGNLMAFMDIKHGCEIISCVIFASVYKKIAGIVDPTQNTSYRLLGKKKDKQTLIVEDAQLKYEHYDFAEDIA